MAAKQFERLVLENTDKFFDDKHPWSETKDDLLGNYLTPFFNKVYQASRDGIVYVDAFARPGRFNDGSLAPRLSPWKSIAPSVEAEEPRHPSNLSMARQR